MTEPLNVGDRPINLTQVLKLAGWVGNGGEGKALIADGMVRVNGEVETPQAPADGPRRRRAARRRAELDPRLEPDAGPPRLISSTVPAPIDPPRTKATTMKRIGILTAGGDTPALNATIDGAVERANQARVEVFGIIKGFSGLLNHEVPHVHLNPLFQKIPELDATLGGTILGASRDYVDGDDLETIARVADRLKRLQIDGLICVGGDGTLNGMQPLSNFLPTVLAPKTIDNDLGLNYPDEPNEWHPRAQRRPSGLSLQEAAQPRVRPRRDGQLRHARLRHGGLRLVAERPADPDDGREPPPDRDHRGHGPRLRDDRAGHRLRPARHHPRPRVAGRPRPLVERVISILDVQKHAVICVSEGIVDVDGDILGSKIATHDPAGNIQYTGAAEAVKRLLVEQIGDAYFTRQRRNESANAAIFVRKIGHTQRGGRPIKFDRFYASQLGGKAVELLLDGYHNCVATLQCRDGGFQLDSMDANKLRDRWGVIHARPLPARLLRPQAIPALAAGRGIFPVDVRQRPGSRGRRVHPLDLRHRQPDPPLRLGERPRPQADSPASSRGLSGTSHVRSRPDPRRVSGRLAPEMLAKGPPPAPCLERAGRL